MQAWCDLRGNMNYAFILAFFSFDKYSYGKGNEAIHHVNKFFPKHGICKPVVYMEYSFATLRKAREGERTDLSQRKEI